MNSIYPVLASQCTRRREHYSAPGDEESRLRPRDLQGTRSGSKFFHRAPSSSANLDIDGRKRPCLQAKTGGTPHADKLDADTNVSRATERRTTILRKPTSKTLSADPQFAAVRAHFAEHGTALCYAAGLIDGDTGTARVLRLISGLHEVSRLDRAMRRKLVELHRLLSLDLVGDDPDADLSPWVLLDPASPEVQELCLLTDRLHDLLVKIVELDDEQEALAVAHRARDAA